jgi:energy-converting hydrogenase Eha subunit G
MSALEQAPDTIAIILIVFGGINTALRGNTMGATRAVLKAE